MKKEKDLRMDCNAPSLPARRLPEGVCFDYRGTLVDHRTDGDSVPGMEALIAHLRERHVRMALISRFPVDVLRERLGTLTPYFGEDIFTGGGPGKLAAIRRFARKYGIEDLSRIAFIDDKPDNLLPVTDGSDVFVIGFRGSGKYAETESVCKDRGIAFAEDAGKLERLLLDP